MLISFSLQNDAAKNSPNWSPQVRLKTLKREAMDVSKSFGFTWEIRIRKICIFFHKIFGICQEGIFDILSDLVWWKQLISLRRNFVWAKHSHVRVRIFLANKKSASWEILKLSSPKFFALKELLQFFLSKEETSSKLNIASKTRF